MNYKFVKWITLKTKNKQKLCSNKRVHTFQNIVLRATKKSFSLIPGIFLPYGIQDAFMTVTMIMKAMEVIGMNYIWLIPKKHWIALKGSSKLILNTAKHIFDWRNMLVRRKKHLSIFLYISILTLRIIVRLPRSLEYITN